MLRPATGIARHPFGFSPCRPVSAAVVLPLLLAVPLLVVLLMARRASGALVRPLPPTALVACGLFLAVWAAVAHEWLANCRAAGRNWRNPSLWLPSSVLLPACWALLVPGSSMLGGAVLIALLAGAEGAAWGLRRRDRWSSPRRSAELPAADLPGAAQTVGTATPAGESTDEVIAEIIRHREPDGREAIRGWVQVDLAAGQRTAPVHVAFCPALAGLPSCEAEQVEGPPATIRVAQVLPYGARFDVKLDAPASRAVTLRIEFAATAAAEVGRFD